MKTARKALMLILCAALLVSATVMGTLAYLTDKTDAVTNTFTVGKIDITLTETKGNSFKIVPGATDEKNPTVTVVKGSEVCYVYALVTNNLVLNNKTVATVNVDPAKWESMGTSGNKTLYRYYQTVNAADEDVKLPVFTQVTYDKNEITESNINDLKDKTIVIEAFAHQFANTAQATADAAAKTWAKIS